MEVHKISQVKDKVPVAVQLCFSDLSMQVCLFAALPFQMPPLPKSLYKSEPDYHLDFPRLFWLCDMLTFRCPNVTPRLPAYRMYYM